MYNFLFNKLIYMWKKLYERTFQRWYLPMKEGKKNINFRSCFGPYLARDDKTQNKNINFPQSFSIAHIFLIYAPGPLYLPGSLNLYSFLRFFASCWNEMRVWIYFMPTLSQPCFCSTNIFFYPGYTKISIRNLPFKNKVQIRGRLH